MRIDEFEFQDKNGNEIEPTKNQLVIYIKSLHKQIAELQKQLEEKEKDNQFLKKMYLSERTKNDNYHTEKYGLDKPVEELRKIKLNPKEKKIYYKGFDNCERQFATHIAELQQQLAEKEKEIEDAEITRHMMCGDYTWTEMVTKLMKDKTEFAIQQLQRVKEEMHRGLEFDYDLDIWATEFIDTIINEIKGE